MFVVMQVTHGMQSHSADVLLEGQQHGLHGR